MYLYAPSPVAIIAAVAAQTEDSASEPDEYAVEKAIETGRLYDVATTGIVISKRSEVLADVDARRRDVLRVEESIALLHAMFIDLAIAVERQGEMVDRIETNVEAAAEYVADGGVKLNQASKYVDRYRRKRWILIAGAVVLLFVILFVLIQLFVPFF